MKGEYTVWDMWGDDSRGLSGEGEQDTKRRVVAIQNDGKADVNTGYYIGV